MSVVRIWSTCWKYIPIELFTTCFSSFYFSITNLKVDVEAEKLSCYSHRRIKCYYNHICKESITSSDNKLFSQKSSLRIEASGATKIKFLKWFFNPFLSILLQILWWNYCLTKCWTNPEETAKCEKQRIGCINDSVYCLLLKCRISCELQATCQLYMQAFIKASRPIW